VRLLVNDDEAQGSRARAVFEAEDIWIGKTVLLETFWVLRSVYDFDDMAIASAIEGALGLPRVQVEDSERVKLALAAVADRFDIADALHVATTPGDARAFKPGDSRDCLFEWSRTLDLSGLFAGAIRPDPLRPEAQTDSLRRHRHRHYYRRSTKSLQQLQLW
jgi:predicted nucleic-acid-binding protein